MKCPKCDRQNSPKSKFCGTCGSNLFIACSDCKTNNPAKLKFCGNCGSRLVKGKSVERTPVRPRAKVEETTTFINFHELSLGPLYILYVRLSLYSHYEGTPPNTRCPPVAP